jgi:hypothetical protein
VLQLGPKEPSASLWYRRSNAVSEAREIALQLGEIAVFAISERPRSVEQSWSPQPDAARLRTTIVDEGCIVIDLPHRTCYRLNKVGTFVWLGLYEGKTVAQISLDLMDHFGQNAISTMESVIEQIKGTGLLPISRENAPDVGC